VLFFLPTAPLSADAPARPPRKTILVVEDEEAVRSVIVETLSTQGYRVLEAGNGREGLQVIQRTGEGVDLLITDLIMPVMGGQELADRVRTLRPDLRILFTSGYVDETVLRPSERPESVGFLQKPFSLGALTAAVARALADTASPRPRRRSSPAEASSGAGAHTLASERRQ
jgi:CheY-like chemotaxis protein